MTFYDSINIDNQSVFQINALHTVELEIYKLKKFACKSLKGKGVHSGIRLIYAYSPGSLLIHLIEIYYLNFARNCRFQAVEIDFSRLSNLCFVARHFL